MILKSLQNFDNAHMAKLNQLHSESVDIELAQSQATQQKSISPQLVDAQPHLVAHLLVILLGKWSMPLLMTAHH